jgi:demethylmenaquinone methyltransferase/2-methoxy-6-polyprenyl-1,4-benzoquinol methylase
VSVPAGEPYVRYNTRFFARWAPYYDLFATSIFWVYRATVRLIAPRPGMSVLDICTGTGEIARRCAARGARVTGIDLSPAMLSRARRKLDAGGLRGTLSEMDARALSYPDCSFDVVVISFGLHDMPPQARRRVLREAARVARERLIVADYELPAGRWSSRWWRRMIGWVETPYFESFVRSGAAPLLREQGFRDVAVERYRPAFAIFEARHNDRGPRPA